MSRETFRRHLADLMAVGLTKAQLQNLSGEASNVVPLIQVINIDFGQQHPDWYVEPVSTLDRMAAAAQPTEVVTIERDPSGVPMVTRTLVEPIPGAMPPRSYPSSPGHRLRAVS